MVQLCIALVVMVQIAWLAPSAAALVSHSVVERVVWTAVLLSGSGLLYLITLRLTGIRYTSLLVPPSAR
jgi:hypothetical protein